MVNNLWRRKEKRAVTFSGLNIYQINRRPKKAWLRIVEAAIAIMLIAGVLLTMYLRNSSSRDLSEYVYTIQKNTLDKIASNSDLRAAVLTGDNLSIIKINNTIYPDIPPNLDFYFRICNLGEEEKCSFDRADILNQGKNVYTADRIIVSETSGAFLQKKIRLFLWEKG